MVIRFRSKNSFIRLFDANVAGIMAVDGNTFDANNIPVITDVY